MARVDTRGARQRRHQRIRRKLSGTPDRPRLNVFRSLNHIYVQVVDDLQRRTLVAASDIEPEVRAAVKDGENKTRTAAVIGRVIAERAKAQGIEQVVFDRGGYLYHGRVKALAEAAREAGLKF